MAEQIIREYILKTDQFKSSIDGITSSYKKVEQSADSAEKEFENSFNKGSQGAKRFNDEVKKQPKTISELELRLVKLRELLRDDAKIGTEGFKRISDEIRKSQTELDKLNGKASVSNKTLSNTAKQGTGQFSSLTSSVKGFGAAMGIAFGAEQVISFTKDAIGAASGLNETIDKAGQIFGNNLTEVEKWAEGGAQAFGQSKQQALDAASTFAIFGNIAGKSGDDLVQFSTKFTELASDLASFNDTTPEDAIQAIGAALRGEAEPIMKYGVIMNEATLKQKALEEGIITSTKNALTPQQKVLAATALIYEKTSLQQGNFALTSDGLANSQRQLTAEYANLQASIGGKLLPITLEFVKLFNSLLTGDMPKAKDVFISINETLNPLGLGLSGLIIGFNNLYEAAKLIINGNIVEGFKKIGSSLLDIFSATNPITAGYNYLRKSIFGVGEETDSFANVQERHKAVSQGISHVLGLQSQIYDDLKNKKITDKEATEKLKDTNIALDVIYRNISKSMNLTRAQFDKYVETLKGKTKATTDDNKVDEKKVSLIQRLQNELKTINDRIADTVLKGGIINENDIKRAAEIEKILKELPLLINAAKTGVPDIVPENDLSDDEQKALDDNLKAGREKRNVALNKDLQDASDFLEEKRLNEEKYRDLEKQDLEQYNLIYAGAGEFRVKTEQDELNEKIRLNEEFYAKGIRGEAEYQAIKKALNKETNDVLKQQQQEQYNNAQEVLSLIGNTVSQIGSLINQVYDQQRQEIDATLQAEINAVNASTLSEEGKQAKIEALQKKAAKEQYELQLKAFKVNKALQITNTVIQTAQAVVAGLSAGLQTGVPGLVLGPVTAALAGALGAAQIAIIASQPPPPPPSFAKGSEFIQRGNNKPGIDTIPAYLNEGEAVIPTDKNRQYPGLAKAWIGGKLESYVNNVMLAPKLAEIERKAEERWMSKMLEIQGEKYDDMRLFMATTEGNMYLRTIAKEIKSNNVKKRTAW